ncbi:protein cueball isoform X2 [Zootermopsis nevadensis]|uniref:protein cueball isoform X2 n=1 Tax=Zootermopsis nevadensis TaxID=136037 RepID=UPI000B8EDB10|nr:protein cueball isoform X2 [Zootermopsis nevadensis]
MNTLHVLFHLIFLSLAARSWDIAVVTTNEVDLFSSTGKIVGKLPKPTADLQSLEFDPVHQVLFLSDDTNSNYSVFTLSLHGNQDLRPFIKRADNHKVRDIAYDVVSDSLYWTGETAIYWYTSSMNSEEGTILHKLGALEFPHGITVDSCRRYLYWTNSYHLKPTIERSLLDGTKREVIITKDLFQPMGIAVDELEGKIYWSDDQAGIYYNIKRADLDGSNSETIIHGTHHEPFFLTIHLHNIYWSDLIYNAIWSMPKKPTKGEQPTKIYQYKDGRTPQGIVAWSDGRIVDCEVERTVTVPAEFPNTSEGFMSDGPIGIGASESSVKETAASSDYCLNSGLLLAEERRNAICQCPQGYSGERCEVSLCHNYCLNNGICEIDNNSLPVCICVHGTNGSRCEQHVCNSYCLNSGACEVDNRGQPSCRCRGNFSGVHCEVMDAGHMCRSQCQQFGQLYVPIDGGNTPMCMCPSTVGTGQYDLLPLENNSSSTNNTLSSAELNQLCMHDKTAASWVSAVLGCTCALLLVAIVVLLRKVFILRKRPRIKKRIIVNKNVTPLTSCPPVSPDQCEITIENCCNMNICETPCFEPQLRTSKSSRTEEKKTLLGSMEEAPTSSPYQNELY